MKDINATVIVNLLPSEDEIMKNLHKDARWGIKKAEKEGLIVNESSDWGEFYQIYKDTIKEGGADIRNLAELKENASVLLLCSKDGRVIAGAALKIEDNTPVLYLNASMKEFQPSQPNNLLYWHCIKWSKEKGFSKLDLGGWQINAQGHLEGINKFKEKWGKVVYYEKNYPFFKALGRKLIRNFRIFWWLNKKIRGRK